MSDAFTIQVLREQVENLQSALLREQNINTALSAQLHLERTQNDALGAVFEKAFSTYLDNAQEQVVAKINQAMDSYFESVEFNERVVQALDARVDELLAGDYDIDATEAVQQAIDSALESAEVEDRVINALDEALGRVEIRFR